MTEQELHALAEGWLQCANGEPIYGHDKLAMAQWALRLQREMDVLRMRLDELEKLVDTVVDDE